MTLILVYFDNIFIVYLSIPVDYVSAPFMMHKRDIFKGICDPGTFFSPSLRSYLVSYHLTMLASDVCVEYSVIILLIILMK